MATKKRGKVDAPEHRVTIENVGGIERLEVRVGPGVNVLAAVNGAGKTEARKAVARAFGGKVELEPTDGMESGTVRGPGVQLLVGRNVTREGVADVQLVDSSPLSQLIDPLIKDPAARNRARQRALVRLTGVAADERAVRTLCPDKERRKWLQQEASAGAVEDLFDLSEVLKREYEREAREHEATQQRAEGTAVSAASRCAELLEAAGGEANLTDVKPAKARDALIARTREYERADAAEKGRATLERRQAALRAAIGERPDPAADQADLDEKRAAVARLERELAVARKEEDLTEMRLLNTQKVLRDWEQQQGVLAQPLPELDELGAAARKKIMDAAERTVVLADKSAAYRDAAAERAEAEHDAKRASERAEELRALAAGVAGRLGEVLAAAGVEGITVREGRLVAIDGKGASAKYIDWDDRLSVGQRALRALRIAVPRYRHGALDLDPATWAALDPDAQAAFAAEAAAESVYVITEKPTRGKGVTVEHLG